MLPAMARDSSMSRREMLTRLFRPVRAGVEAALAPGRAAAPGRPLDAGDGSMLAVVAGRDCLAYQGTPCRVCVDRCPVAGALVLEQGLPWVVPDCCTGCRVCHEVCPAPVNAIRIVPRPPGLPPLRSVHAPFPPLAPQGPA